MGGWNRTRTTPATTTKTVSVTRMLSVDPCLCPGEAAAAIVGYQAMVGRSGELRKEKTMRRRRRSRRRSKRRRKRREKTSWSWLDQDPL